MTGEETGLFELSRDAGRRAPAPSAAHCLCERLTRRSTWIGCPSRNAGRVVGVGATAAVPPPDGYGPGRAAGVEGAARRYAHSEHFFESVGTSLMCHR